MAMKETQKLKCPKCGQLTEHTIINVFNSVDDADLVEKIINFNFFDFCCENCGEKLILTNELIFHDVISGTEIYLVSRENIDGVLCALSLQRQLDTMNHNSMSVHKPVRVVDSYHKFREKLMLLNAGIDDKIIELLKIYYFDPINNEYPELKIEDALFFFDKNKPALKYYGDGGSASMHIQKSDFDDIIEDFSCALYHANPFIVDKDWAMSFLDKDTCLECNCDALFT